MIAFVMSGAGNRGALEAGALLALLEAGIQPEMLVGTSSGALNAAFLATNPTLAGAKRLASIWRRAQTADFFPGGTVSALLRLVQGQSLFPNENLRRFAETHLPARKRLFGRLPIKLYITAANLNTGQLYLWGDDPNASVGDAAIASAALPLAFPPVKFQNYQLVDGGVVANVPIGIAVEKGATELYVLNVTDGLREVPEQTTVVDQLGRCFDLLFNQPFLLDLKYVKQMPNVTVHLIHLTGFTGWAMWDLSKSSEMIKVGRKTAHDFLTRRQIGPPPPAPYEPPPPGASDYTPSWLREKQSSPVDVQL